MFEFRPYQLEAAKILSDLLQERQFALDGSDTGIGKTFTAIATALEFDPPPPVAVICRASAQTKWRDALALFNIEPVFLFSWDKARNKKNPFFIPLRNRRGNISGFNLRLHEPTLVIVDEIHAAGAVKSQNAQLVIAAAQCPNAYVLGLSASIADSPLKLYAVGFCLGLHTLSSPPSDFWSWCRKNGCGKAPFGGMYFRKRDRERVLLRLHETLFGPKPRGVRLRKKDLMQAGQFPESEVFVELWDVGTIAASPAWLRPYLEDVDKSEEKDNEKHDYDPHGGIIAMRDRQRSELIKVPALISDIEDRLEEGESVIVFLQFTKTLEAVASRLDGVPYSVVAGMIPRSLQLQRGNISRDEQLRLFQSGEHRLILCQTDAGSESIDLHDTDGRFPRHVIVFPTYKSVTLIQALGRAVRSGAKSPVVQRIVYSSGGIEEKIARVIESRLENLSLLSDGELNAAGLL